MTISPANTAEKTEVISGNENATKTILQILSESEHSLDACGDSISQFMSTELIRQACIELSKRNARARFIIEITMYNLPCSLELMKIGEVRHLEGIKSNLLISDAAQSIVIIVANKLHLISQLNYISVKEVVEQQCIIFEALWNNAIPAEIKAKEFEGFNYADIKHNDNVENEKRDNEILRLIEKRLDKEGERSNRLDTKSGNLIGFISVVIGLLLGAGAFKLSILLQFHGASLLYFIGIGILLISIIFSLGAFKIRNWIVVPDTRMLIDKYKNRPYRDLVQSTAGEMSKAVIHSERENDNKAKLIRWSWYFLIAGLSIIFIFAIAYTVTGSK